ncbi:hypothetical protein VKT23_020106 [Stygiomarasmius scandens]|uniref:Uncharacterized protein n=1 Tax=Marasmiellus scandens TaxID=2682957 RepID=A0ABR1ILQ8_9AGAR
MDYIEVSSDEEMEDPKASSQALLAHAFLPCVDPDNNRGDWDWVKDRTWPPDAREYQGTWQLPDIPLGQENGRLWLFASCYQVSHKESTLVHRRYSNAAHAAIASRSALTAEIVTWDDPPLMLLRTQEADIDDASWCRDQVHKCQNRRGPIPSFSGMDIQRRRLATFAELRSVHKELRESRDRLYHLGKAWWEIRGYHQEIEGRIWKEISSENK